MAARPTPLSALRVCTNLAKNSIRRIDALIDATQRALDTNVRLTPSERRHYQDAIKTAKVLRTHFVKISKVKLPKPPATTNRKVGRPSEDEIARARKRSLR